MRKCFDLPDQSSGLVEVRDQIFCPGVEMSVPYLFQRSCVWPCACCHGAGILLTPATVGIAVGQGVLVTQNSVCAGAKMKRLVVRSVATVERSLARYCFWPPLGRLRRSRRRSIDHAVALVPSMSYSLDLMVVPLLLPILSSTQAPLGRRLGVPSLYRIRFAGGVNLLVGWSGDGRGAYCQGGNCSAPPSYSVDGKKPAVLCGIHREDGMHRVLHDDRNCGYKG